MQGNLGKAKVVISRNGALRHSRGVKPNVRYAARVSSIAFERESRLSETESLRRGGLLPESFVDKAETLLTQRWSKATWRSREQLLRTVDWLLRMERMRRKHAGPSSSFLASIPD